uniref:Uncharacterized protein n=1 Tax=Trichogramma kaykai TaxID=54128 RepID=A0ABD2X992_9HYME
MSCGPAIKTNDGEINSLTLFFPRSKEYKLYAQTILHRINKEMIENDQLYQFISNRSNGHSFYKKAINAVKIIVVSSWIRFWYTE